MRRLITKSILDMETLQWVYEESCPYNGLWEWALGVMDATKTMAKEQTMFMETLMAEQSTQFANEQEALTTVKNAWEPIAKGGAYQYGFSTAEDQALQSQIETAGATATANSVAAQQLREQQQTGGASVLPTGAQSAIEAQQRELGAQATAANLGKEKELGYEVGRENFAKATSAEEAIAGLANPPSFANAEAGSMSAFNELNNSINAMNANSLTGKILGGVIGSAIPIKG